MKKETLKQQQARLDKEKWIRSIDTSCDQSGMMYYCKNCNRSNGYHCSATQDERVSGSLCARSARKSVGVSIVDNSVKNVDNSARE